MSKSKNINANLKFKILTIIIPTITVLDEEFCVKIAILDSDGFASLEFDGKLTVRSEDGQDEIVTIKRTWNQQCSIGYSKSSGKARPPSWKKDNYGKPVDSISKMRRWTRSGLILPTQRQDQR